MSANPSSKSRQDQVDTSANEARTADAMQDRREHEDLKVPSTHHGKGNASALGYGGDGRGDRDVVSFFYYVVDQGARGIGGGGSGDSHLAQDGI